jgi:hypothetical protein
LRLPRLTDEQFLLANKLVRNSGISPGTCPTCGSKEFSVTPDHFGREDGTYMYLGEEWECDCQTQILLNRHYLLANIPDQFQRLNWVEFRGSVDIVNSVDEYIIKWPSMKVNGMGVEFSAVNQGVGKTFAATHIAKELVRIGEKVYFIPFRNLVSALASGQERELTDKLKNVTVLVLDEVVPAITDLQHSLFAELFEEIIRDRTNFNRVTIMTTNMTTKDLRTEYPRTYSLLEAKQIRLEMGGEDARQTFIAQENLELAFNEEVRPIT